MLLHVLQCQPRQDALHAVQIANSKICTTMSTGKPKCPVPLSWALAHCLSLSVSRAVSGLGISASRLGGSVCNGFVFLDVSIHVLHLNESE